MPLEFKPPSLARIQASPNGSVMMSLIEEDNFRCAFVTGCPGSGKTTVAVLRFMHQAKMGRDVTLLTFHRLLSRMLEDQIRGQGATAGRVTTFMKWHYWMSKREPIPGGLRGLTPELLAERLQASRYAKKPGGEIIFDETQDLPACVCAQVPKVFKRAFVTADDGQQVHPENGATAKQISDALHQRYERVRVEILHHNYRNTYETYRFARQFIPKDNRTTWNQNILDRLRRDNRRGRKPEVISYRDPAVRSEHMMTTVRNAPGNVAILCREKSEVDEMADAIREVGIAVSKYHSAIEAIPDPLERYLITTYKSAKGMEFDTVIIPRVNYKEPIAKEWYVACTRSKGQLFVYRDLSGGGVDPLSTFDPDTYDEENLDGVAPAGVAPASLTTDDDIPF